MQNFSRKSFFFILFLSFLATSAFAQNPQIEYTISMSKPYTHYFEVKIEINNWTKDSIDLKLPVWTPGSYLVRDYPKDVDSFIAKSSEGKNLKFHKEYKNTWRVFNGSEKNLNVTYEVYSFNYSLRTNFLNSDQGYVIGANTFMYIEGFKNLPLTLTVVPYKNWKVISTGLEDFPDNKWKFKAPDYDILADCPLQIGNHKVFHFAAAGVDYQVAMVGKGNYDIDTLLHDLKKIVKTETAVFGENPNKKYVFIIHNTDRGGGGLEHLNSTTLQVNRFIYKPKSSYLSFLGLVAHEHFHLWNVKRMRPKALGPFNYNKANYTTLLWVAEGITDYYSTLTLKRAGFINADEFLKRLTNVINRVKNNPGNDVQTVAEASFDAWIKAYQPNENSINTTVSYYDKGMVLGALLDLEIIKNSKGKNDLDDVMRYMYDKYYKELKRGYTKKEWQRALEKFAGENLNTFFSDYIYGTKPIDYQKYFNYAGIKILEIPENTKPYLGIGVSERDGKLLIHTVIKNTPAYNYGLNVHDEIIAINNYRADMSVFQKIISTSNLGDTLNFTISRKGILRNLKVALGKDENTDFNLFRSANMTKDEKLVYNKWLSENIK